MNRLLLTSTCALAWAAFVAGCASDPDVPAIAAASSGAAPMYESSDGAAKAPAFAQKWADKSMAEGTWVGEWQALGAQPGDAGKFISAKCLEVRPGEWIAKFDAVCDSEYTFTVEMAGQEREGMVVFAGVADLGVYGVYNWSGQVDGQTFVGQYEGGGHQGGFTMLKEPEFDPVVEAFCEAPAAPKPDGR
jgi:hypothetical protein